MIYPVYIENWKKSLIIFVPYHDCRYGYFDWIFTKVWSKEEIENNSALFQTMHFNIQ